MTIREAEALHSRLLAALRLHEVVAVDCAAATEIDASFLQLLVAARHTAQGWGKTFVLSAPAQGPLRQALMRCGFLGADGGPLTKDAMFWTEGSGAT